VDQEVVTAHEGRLRFILDHYPRDRIINMDEATWKLLNHGFLTVAIRGSETANCYFEGEPKTCLTPIAAVDAAGGKLPLWILCKGRTTRCERRFRLDRRLARPERKGELAISHAPSGWTTEHVARNYLIWLREFMGPGPIALVWDVFAAHRCEAARAQAQSMGILLKLIPAGTTGERQPLDQRICGNLKGRAKARFD
jgi:hypothetical protein